MGERGDILRTMQRAMSGAWREFVVSVPAENAGHVVGRVAAKGMADELYDRGYLVVDGTDGKAHYIALGAKVDSAIPRRLRGRSPWFSLISAPPTETSPRAQSMACIALTTTWRWQRRSFHTRARS